MATRVDIHSHLYPRVYLDALAGRSEPPRVASGERLIASAAEEATGGRPLTDADWSLDAKLAFMRDEGIDQSVVSLGNPWLDGIAGAADLARAVNAEFASFRAATQDRVVGLGVLPQDDVATAVAVAEEVADCDTLHGLVNGTRIAGLRLDDARLEPLWQLLAQRRLPLVLHPHHGVGPEVPDGVLALALGFPFETTIAVARMALAGVLARYPDLTVVPVHGGGALPYLAGRIDAAWRLDERAQARLPHPPSADLGRLCLDTVLYSAGAIRAAADLVGEDRLMYGTDHPYPIADPPLNLDALAAALPAAAAARVAGEAAVDRFGLPEV